MNRMLDWYFNHCGLMALVWLAAMTAVVLASWQFGFAAPLAGVNVVFGLACGNAAMFWWLGRRRSA